MKIEVDENQVEYIGHGLRVALDKTRVHHEDPGVDTPAMVYLEEDQGTSATYTLAADLGELTCNYTGCVVDLSKAQVDWLQSLEEDIDEFLQW